MFVLAPRLAGASRTRLVVSRRLPQGTTRPCRFRGLGAHPLLYLRARRCRQFRHWALRGLSVGVRLRSLLQPRLRSLLRLGLRSFLQSFLYSGLQRLLYMNIQSGLLSLLRLSPNLLQLHLDPHLDQKSHLK